MLLDGSLQYLMIAAAIAAASQLLLFLNLVAAPRTKRPALTYRMIVSSRPSSDSGMARRKGSDA
jgi:hypothetical protein